MSRISIVAAIGVVLSTFAHHHGVVANPLAPPVNYNISIPGIDTNPVKHFDCPKTTTSHLSLKELQEAMDEFAYTFYTAKNVEQAFNKFVASNYVQHNPTIADGRDAAIKALDPIFASADRTTQIARVMVGPEYTTVHHRARTAGQPDTNVVDIYRTQGSCIVEHWDALQTITNATAANAHPYF